MFEKNLKFLVSKECEDFIETLKTAVSDQDQECWATLSEYVNSIGEPDSSFNVTDDKTVFEVKFTLSEDIDLYENLGASIHDGDEESDELLHMVISEIELVSN